jgi:hypothetical protein
VLGSIVQALPEPVRNATLQQIGQKDSTMAATVASAALPADIGGSILRGIQAIKVDERNDPSKGTNKQAFEDGLDKHLPGAIFSDADRTNPNGAYAMMRGAVTYRLADMLSRPESQKTVTDAMVKQATDDVTGGVLDSHGQPIIAPKRGVNQGQFDGMLFGLTDADLRGAATLSGTPLTAEYVRSSAKLQSLDDGRYLVKIGNGVAYQYVDTERPSPFILDLRNRQPAPNYVPSNFNYLREFTGYPRG